MSHKQSLIAIALAAVTAVSAHTAMGAELTVRVGNLASDAGFARIVVMNSELSYMGKAPVGAIASAPIENGTGVWKADLPAGDYAVIAHHDANANDELDRPLFGLPLEPYGYSSGADTAFGLPAWKAVRFRIDDAPVTQDIRVKLNPFAAVLLAIKAGWPAWLAIAAGLIAVGAIGKRRRAQSL